MKSIYFIVIITFLLYLDCISQIYSTQRYTSEDGLPTRTVYDITQDSTGRIWFGTGLGISRYDGFKFENFDFTKGIFKISYRRIICDENSYIWGVPFYSKDSIRVLKNGQWYSIPIPQTSSVFAENSAFDVYYENENPVLCLGTSEGVFIYKDNIWKRYGEEDGLICNSVTNVCAFEKIFYISTKKGLSVFNSVSFDNSLNNIISKEPSTILKIYFQKPTTSIGKDKAKMWILMPNKLGYIENGKFSVLTTDFEIPDITSFLSYSMVFDKRDNIYFGSPYVKYYININKRNVVRLFKENGFVSNGCTSIFLDKEENLWVSDIRGVNKLNSLAFRNHNSALGLEEDDVASINEIAPGKFIFGHNSGMTIWEKNKYKYISFKKFENRKLNSSRVLDICKDKNGNIWLAAFSMGIGKMDKTGNIVWMKVPDSTRFTSVIQDDNGEIFASSEGGIFIFKDGTFIRCDNDSLNNIRKLFNLNDSKIWAATSRGICIYQNNKTYHIKTVNNFEANSIYSIFKDNKSRIFAGTQDGLYLIQGDSMVKFNENNFTIDDPVYAMVQDKNNNYWFGTNKNLIFWDGDKIIKEYNSKNGLVQGEINRSALFFDSEDRLWIGTDMGVSRYISELDNNKSFIPKVELISIVENGGNIVPYDGDINFSYKDNNLKFLFRGISFVNENSIEYKIKLEGYDKDWITVRQQRIEDIMYKNLKPGDYVFKVKARNSSGEWSNEVVSKKITIENPFYYKWWFIILEIFVVILIFMFFSVLYNKKKYLNKLEKEVVKRTTELNKSKEDLIKSNERLEERVKERTHELEESEKEFREVVELLPETIFEADIDGRIIFTNMAGYEKFGYSTEDLGNLSVFDVVVPENLDRAVKYFKNVISGNDIKGIEFKALKKDGKTFPVYINSVPIISSGETKGIRGIAFDLTNQKIIEEKLSKLSKEQKELIASKDKFFSIIAHDLRNPFTGLFGFSQVLHEEASNLSREEIENYSGHIKDSAGNLLGLLDNLLQWGRLQTGKLEATLEKINLFKKIDYCISLLSHNANKKEISVFNYIKNDVYVNADNFMLDSIIQNLLMNSIKFTPRKGRIEFSAEISDGFVVISLSDTGIGLSSEQIENIFRIDKRNTTLGTENEPGTGLGIILCKEMIEKQGGTLTIKSEVGKGSIFKFSLSSEKIY